MDFEDGACYICSGPGTFLRSVSASFFKQSSARFRCLDCFGGPMLCEGCIVNQHVLNPFHRIQVK